MRELHPASLSCGARGNQQSKLAGYPMLANVQISVGGNCAMPLVRSIEAKENFVNFSRCVRQRLCNRPSLRRLAGFAALLCGSLSTFTFAQSLPNQSTTSMTGNFTAGTINYQAQVDGTTNSSLAAAVGSLQCFGDGSSSQNGCVIWDGLPEVFETWPLLGAC